MLVVSIIMLLLALVVGGFAAAGGVGAGALTFALGFLVLGAVAATSHFSHRAY
jgi:hypothetical protein